MRSFLIAALVAVAAPSADAEMGVALTVTVGGATPNTGQIIATLFDSEATYMKAPTAEQTIRVDQNGQAALIFENLATGEYAVSVIFDENSNGVLDTGFLRIPKEKIGFSNNAKPKMGPPPYDKVKFILMPENNEINITLE